MVRGKLKATLTIPEGYEAELVATSLRSNGWQSLSYSEVTCEITGDQKKTEYKAAMSFLFDYKVRCSWLKSAEQTEIFVEVVEQEGNANPRDCQKIAYDIISGVANRAGPTAAKLAVQPRNTLHGGDRFADLGDLEEAEYVSSECSGNNLLIAPLDDTKKLVIPEDEACRHALVCGPTGCGKTSSVFIPNLIERNDVSALVTEATSGAELPDLYAKTSGFRAAAGHKIFYFNPDDLSSTRINPVDFVTTQARAQELASLIMRNTASKFKQNGESKFWQDSETQLLTSLLMHVSSNKGNLAQIRALLREGPERVGEIMEGSRVAAAKDEYNAYLKVSTDNIRNGVMCGLLQRLNNWVNPKVVALTERSDIEIADLASQLFTFYFAVPSDKEALKPVACLVLNYVLNTLKDIAKEKYKHKLALYLDEFTNFGYIPALPTAMAIIRHQEIPIMLGCQDYSQIKIEYGEDETKKIFSNVGTRFVFRTADINTAKQISESLGQETVVERKLNTACQVVEKEVGKPLMRPSEVMALPKDISIVFTPTTPPVKVKRFSWQDYSDRTCIAPPYREAIQIDEGLSGFCQKESVAPPWQKQAEEKLARFESLRQTTENSKANSTSNTSNTQQKRSPLDFEIPI